MRAKASAGWAFVPPKNKTNKYLYIQHNHSTLIKKY
jgi:hypothetical protein